MPWYCHRFIIYNFYTNRYHNRIFLRHQIINYIFYLTCIFKYGKEKKVIDMDPNTHTSIEHIFLTKCGVEGRVGKSLGMGRGQRERKPSTTLFYRMVNFQKEIQRPKRKKLAFFLRERCQTWYLTLKKWFFLTLALFKSASVLNYSSLVLLISFNTPMMFSEWNCLLSQT